MEFGHIQEIADIDFSLPPDTTRTKQVLAAASADGDLQVFIGASKWGEKAWTGKIYPPKTLDKAFLPLYSMNFNTVELGSTFYSLPGPEQVAKWVNDVADQRGLSSARSFRRTSPISAGWPMRKNKRLIFIKL